MTSICCLSLLIVVVVIHSDGQVANNVRVQSGTTPDNDGSTTSDSSSTIAAGRHGIA